MRSTRFARAAGRAERERIGNQATADELFKRVLGRLDELKIDVIAVSQAQMEGSRAEVDAESGVIKYDETLPLAEALEVLAHELGHLVLHGRLTDPTVAPDPVMASAYGDAGPAAIARYSPRVREEAEANAFALEFTCPSDAVFPMWRPERAVTS